MSKQTTLITSPIVRRDSLTISVTPACWNCGAPGLYQSNVSFIESYPEIYRPTWNGRPVGETCPCCGAIRSATIDKGEVWSREYRVETFFEKLSRKIKELFKSSRRKGT
jgi:hypothetical protein